MGETHHSRSIGRVFSFPRSRRRILFVRVLLLRDVPRSRLFSSSSPRGFCVSTLPISDRRSRARPSLQEQKATFFGEHRGITCDGCGVVPIVGFRYRCQKCPNHDTCEVCYERWDGGKGSVANGHAQQELSLDPAAHDFVVHKAGGFKPMVKTQGATQKSEKKLKPNDPCHCGSGKKLKKCCGGAA